MTSLGERLRTRRWDELRYHQEDTAAAAGLSPSRLSEIEHGRHRVGEPALRRLAAVLGLDADDLVAHARREDRLAVQQPKGLRTPEPVGPPPVPVPVRPDLPRPPKRWLTTGEAAPLLGLTRQAVADLIRAGILAPATRRSLGKGPARWLVEAQAVLAYEPPHQGRRAGSGPHPVPAGYRSLRAFADAAGLSYGALHRRLEAGEIASVRIGTRRLIPERELARFLDEGAAAASSDSGPLAPRS